MFPPFGCVDPQRDALAGTTAFAPLWWRAVFICIGVAALLGCAEYSSAPLIPTAELDALRSRSLESIRIDPAVNTAASAPFDPSDGLDESELVAIALTLHPELRTRRIAIGETIALTIAAGLWPNPELGASLRPGVGIPGVAMGLDVLFELLRGDLREARVAVADSQVEAARAALARDEYQVAAETRKAHVAILVAERVERSLAAEAELRVRATEFIRQRREMGEATELEVAAVELERVDVELALRAARFGVESRKRALLAVLGLPPNLQLSLTGSGRPLPVALSVVPTSDEIDSSLLANRIDLRAVEAEYRIAEDELRLAIEGQYPSVAVGPSFEREVEGVWSAGIAGTVEIPLFNRNQAEIAARRAARDVARANYAATLHAVRTAAFAARDALERSRDELAMQERDVLPLIERNERLFEQSFTAGETTVFEWLAVRSRALAARRAYVDALVVHAAALVEFEIATGTSVPSQPSNDRR